MEIATKLATDFRLGRGYTETANMYRTEIRNSNIAIGTDSKLHALLSGTIDIDNKLIARAKNIVLGGGDIHLGLEREVLIIKDVATKDFLS